MASRRWCMRTADLGIGWSRGPAWRLWKRNGSGDIAPLRVKTMRRFACSTARLNCARDGGVMDDRLFGKCAWKCLRSGLPRASPARESFPHRGRKYPPKSNRRGLSRYCTLPNGCNALPWIPSANDVKLAGPMVQQIFPHANRSTISTSFLFFTKPAIFKNNSDTGNEKWNIWSYYQVPTAYTNLENVIHCIYWLPKESPR